MNSFQDTLVQHKDLWPFYLGAGLSVLLVGLALVSQSTSQLWAFAFYPLLLGALVCIILRHRALHRELDRVSTTLHAVNKAVERRRRGPDAEAAFTTLHAATLGELSALKDDATPTKLFAQTVDNGAKGNQPTPRYEPAFLTQQLDEAQILSVHFPEDDALDSAPTVPESATWLPVDETQ